MKMFCRAGYMLFQVFKRTFVTRCCFLTHAPKSTTQTPSGRLTKSMPCPVGPENVGIRVTTDRRLGQEFHCCVEWNIEGSALLDADE